MISMEYIKEHVIIENSSPHSGCSGFYYLNGPLPYYVQRHITVNKM